MTHVSLLFAALLLSSPLQVQSAATAPSDTAIADFMNRAADTEPGTYLLGGTAPERTRSEIPLLVQADVLKGPNNSIRVPIAIGTDAKSAITVRLRIIEAGAGPRRAVAEGTGAGGPGPVRLVRDFSLLPGSYEVVAVAGERRSGSGATVVTLARTRLNVPDVWNAPLAMTPLVLGDGVVAGPDAAPKPFSFGHSSISPAMSARFPQQGALNVAFRIYNWTPAPDAQDTVNPPDRRKPDLTVEYAFYQKTAKRLAFFNKVKPQRLAGDTLDKNFDSTARAVAGGMMIPLVSFPFGDFELKVTVTDNRSHATSERRVPFTVAP